MDGSSNPQYRVLLARAMPVGARCGDGSSNWTSARRDAVQEALIDAAEQWPRVGFRDKPSVGLIRVHGVAYRSIRAKLRAAKPRKQSSE